MWAEMPLPPDGQTPPAVNGANTYHDDAPRDATPWSNGHSQTQMPLPVRQQSNDMVTHPPQRDVAGGGGEEGRAVTQQRQAGSRRPSGQQRTCGKCQRHLTGQFVRALGDTYHLECFTCHVWTTPS